MTQLATDNFTRANANPIGGNWTTSPGDAALQIVSNKAAPGANTGYASAYWNAITWPNDQWSEVTLDTENDIAYITAIVRMSGTDQTYYSAFCQGPLGSGHLLVIKFVAGSATTLFDSGIVVVVNSGDILRLSALGTQITLYVNGVSQFQTNDSSISSGSAGMGFYSTSGSDVLLVSKWSGGDFASGINPVSGGPNTFMGTMQRRPVSEFIA